jgi:hypothetical protein
LGDIHNSYKAKDEKQGVVETIDALWARFTTISNEFGSR